MLVQTRVLCILIALSVGIGESCGMFLTVTQTEVVNEEVPYAEYKILEAAKRQEVKRTIAFFYHHHRPIQYKELITPDEGLSPKCITARYLHFRIIII